MEFCVDELTTVTLMSVLFSICENVLFEENTLERLMREKDSDEFSMRDWSLVLLMMNEPSIVLLIFVELMMRERFAVLFGATIGPKSCKGPERLPPLVVL